MSDNEDEYLDTAKSNQFLASMSSLEGGKKRFLHGTDESQILNIPLEELTGSKLTVESLLFDEEDKGKKKKRPKQKKLSEVGEQKIEQTLKKIYDLTVEKSKKLSLPAPLTNPQAQKAARGATYRKVKEDVKPWDTVIHSRRAAQVVSFPLEKPDLKLKSLSQHHLNNFKARTPLEEAVLLALQGGRPSTTDSDQKIKAGLSFKEQLHRMQEMNRLKAHLRYQEAKVARQNRIKSKTYRRHMRKQKAKEKQKEMEELQKTDPELFEEKYGDNDGQRTLERATLKHSRANKNKKLQFMTQADKKGGEKARTNLAAKTIVDTMAQKRREILGKKTASLSDAEDEGSASDEEVLNGDEVMPAFNVDVLLSEEKNPWIKESEESEEAIAKLAATLQEVAKKNKKVEDKADVNPNDFGLVKERKLAKVNVCSDDDEDTSDDEQTRRDQIGQIFADDDLITKDFESEKSELRRSKKTKEVNMRLPGWGSWVGGSENQNRGRKRRKPLERIKPGLKLPKQEKLPTKDDMCTSVDHVIVGDDKSNLRNLQLNNIPFPFTSVADFEASLRLPMGDTFIPRTSHKKMIQPKEKIPMGAVIEPMDRETLVKRKLAEPRIELEIKE